MCLREGCGGGENGGITRFLAALRMTRRAQNDNDERWFAAGVVSCPCFFAGGVDGHVLTPTLSRGRGSLAACGVRVSLGGLEGFDVDVLVGVDADGCGGEERLADDVFGGEVCVFDEDAGGGEGVGAAGADGDDAVVGFYDFAGTGKQERVGGVGDGEEGLEASEVLVGAPVFGEFDGGALQVGFVLGELGIEALEEGDGVGGGAGEPGEHFAVGEASYLDGVMFDDGISERDLSVASEGDHSVVTDRDDSGTLEHVIISLLHPALNRGTRAVVGRGRADGRGRRLFLSVPR